MNGGVDVAIVCEIPHIDTAQIRTDVLPTQYRVNQTSNPPPLHTIVTPHSHTYSSCLPNPLLFCVTVLPSNKKGVTVMNKHKNPNLPEWMGDHITSPIPNLERWHEIQSRLERIAALVEKQAMFRAQLLDDQ
jgi:hypothetical protein